MPKFAFKPLVAGGSDIKFNALSEGFNRLKLVANVERVRKASSDVNEQPEGEEEILLGANNRVNSAYKVDDTGDIYFAYENGIAFQEKEQQWRDYAIALAFLPKLNLTKWVRSDSVVFPTEAVIATRQKPGGFKLNTVGKTMQEMGIVKRHDDPHIDLDPLGRSREELLTTATMNLLRQIFDSDQWEFFIKSYRADG